MKRVLLKRFPRELKKNLFRYLSLYLLITFSLFVVFSIVDASERIIQGTEKNQEQSRLEDGQVTVFMPFTEEQVKSIEENGVTLEPHFHFEIMMEDGSVLQVFENREKIDLFTLDEGRLAGDASEVVLEKRYCNEKGIKTGDSIMFCGEAYQVVGIGSSVDYDAPYRKLADMVIDSSAFGTAFVTKESYDNLKKSGSSEELTYAFLLGGMDSAELKQMIKDFSFDYDSVDDPYYQELLKDSYGKKDDLVDGINELFDGSKELCDGAKELKDGANDLQEGTIELKDGAAKLEDGLKALKDGVAELKDGTGELKKTGEQFAAQVGQMTGGQGELYGAVTMFAKGVAKADEGTGSLKEGIDKASEGAERLSDGTNELVDGAGDLADGANELYDGTTELYDGIKELKEKTDDLINQFFDKGPENITSFMLREENNRIGGASGDVFIDRYVGLFAGVVIMVLFTYVLSVFVIHQIQNESSVIGALYSLGVRKKDLLVHYVTLPTIVCFLGGITGALLGIGKYGSEMQMADSYHYFSIPYFEMVVPVYLIIYTVIMPPVVSVIVNFLVINKALSRTALSLLRNEQSVSRGKDVNLGKLGFISKYRIRQLLRERRSAVTVVVGMLISMMVFMLGMDTYVLCETAGRLNSEDTKYNYLYLFKYPTKEVPEGGEACFMKTLKKEQYGYVLDVTIMGIDDENPYYNVKTSRGKNKIVSSDAVAKRYHVGKGEKLVLSDTAEDIDYAFTVDDVVPYSAGLTVFMNIDDMRELFGEDEDYYNAVLSSEKLDIEEGRIYSVTTKEDIDRSSKIFLELMQGLFVLLIGASIAIFCIVMYLMLTVMIDRASTGISLLKVFGYRPGEVKKLYLDGNRMVIIVGALISVPIAKIVIDKLFPVFVANAACALHMEFSLVHYLMIFGGILLSYEVINLLLMRKLNRVSQAEVLKNRE